MKNFTYFFIVALLMFSCRAEREEKKSLQLSGAYSIDKWDVYSQDPDGNFSQSMNTETECGNLILNKTMENETKGQQILFYPNVGKNMTFTCANYNSVFEPYYWELESELNKELTIWTEDPSSGHTYASIYTIEKKNEKLTLTGVYGPVGGKIKEVIELSRKY